MIDEGVARTKKVPSAPREARGYLFPGSLEDARETCTPKGRCLIGWIVANSGHGSRDECLDIHIGEGRPRPRTP